MKVLTDVNIQGIDRLVLMTTRCCSRISLCSRKTLQEKNLSSVNMKIFIVLKDHHAELPDLTMLDCFGDLDDKFWNISKHSLEHIKA